MSRLLLLTVAPLLLAVGLMGCAPIPVETGPHPVEVRRTTASVDVPFEATKFTANDTDQFFQAILEKIQAKKNAASVPGSEFMARVFPGRDSATLAELTTNNAIEQIQSLTLTHIILLQYVVEGTEKHGRFNAVVSLVATDQLSKPEFLSFDAEGHRTGMSLPLPYILLFFPYSDPDVLGSATAEIAEALATKINTPPNHPPRLTLLASDNLAEPLVRSHTHAAETKAPGDPEDLIERWQNPFGFYSDVMSDAREEGDWAYYNPVTHAQVLFTSIFMAPVMVVTEGVVAVVEPESAADSSGANMEASTDDVVPRGPVKKSVPETHLQSYYDAIGNNPTEALRSLCKSADMGHPEARYRIALLYENGSEGLPQDYTKAYTWYALAAQAQHLWAQKHMERLRREHLTPEALVRALDRRRQWQPGQCESELGLSQQK